MGKSQNQFNECYNELNQKIANAIVTTCKREKKIEDTFKKILNERMHGKILSTEGVLATYINNWIAEQTNGMIREIAIENPKEILFVLLNAISFESDWKDQYESEDIEDNKSFTNSDKSTSWVTYLRHEENNYIENEMVSGFTKDYMDSEFTFMALLPKKKGKMAQNKAISKINFQELYNSRKFMDVDTYIPEYECSFMQDMTGVFSELGVNRVFSRQNFRL